MAKSVVVLILSIFTIESVFPCLDLAEFSRLADLWSHFQKHKRETADFTLLEFLNMHYNDPQHSKSTPLDHQKLPFSKRPNHRVPAFQMTLDIVNVNPKSVYTCLWEILGVDYSVSYSSKVASSVWQPPKI